MSNRPPPSSPPHQPQAASNGAPPVLGYDSNTFSLPPASAEFGATPCPFCSAVSVDAVCPTCHRGRSLPRRVCPTCTRMTPIVEPQCMHCGKRLSSGFGKKLTWTIVIVLIAFVLGVLQAIMS